MHACILGRKNFFSMFVGRSCLCVREYVAMHSFVYAIYMYDFQITWVHAWNTSEHMCICMCIGIHIHIRIRIHTHTHTHIHTHIHTYTHTHTYTYIHTYTHTHTYIHTKSGHTSVIYVTCNRGARFSRWIHMHTHIHTHTYTQTNTQTHIHTYTHTHIHISTHIHTHTHTHTHTHPQPEVIPPPRTYNAQASRSNNQCMDRFNVFTETHTKQN
jgi:hypothetical protein